MRIRIKPSLRGWLVLMIGLAPALGAVAIASEFATQDGPSHLYNAVVAADILWGRGSDESLFANTFEIGRPLAPNWGGMAARLASLALLPIAWSDRALAILTALAFAVGLMVLRLTISGPRGAAQAGLVSAFLSLNIAWLLGFEGFSLGLGVGFVTLSVWRAGRDRMGWRLAIVLALLTTIGYFCHLVSMGLTAVSIAALAAMTPGSGPDRRRRWLWTAWGLAPLLPLGAAYVVMSREGGPNAPIWEHLDSYWSLSSWRSQLVWVDPFALAGKTQIPFADRSAPWAAVFAPSLWAVAGFALLAFATWRSAWRAHWCRNSYFNKDKDKDKDADRSQDGPDPRDRRGALIVAALWIAGGLLGPDALGAGNGHYLPQRLLLFGCALLVVVGDFSLSRAVPRAGFAALTVAWALQSVWVWDYSRLCRERCGDFLRCAPALRSGDRVAALLTESQSPFRANPLLHFDGRICAEANAILWGDYETIHYYFPVQFRRGLDRPPAREFEELARLDGPDNAPARAERLRALIERHSDVIDVFLVWSARPAADLDAILRERYRPLPPFQGRWSQTLRRKS